MKKRVIGLREPTKTNQPEKLRKGVSLNLSGLFSLMFPVATNSWSLSVVALACSSNRQRPRQFSRKNPSHFLEGSVFIFQKFNEKEVDRLGRCKDTDESRYE